MRWKILYNSILVPHAGSKAGNIALKHAQQIAKLHNSKVTILHIVEHVPSPPLLTFSHERKELAKQLASARREMKIEMHKKMEKLARTLRSQKIPTSIKVVHGYPEEEISRIVKSQNHDLVIMAKRRNLTGSKAILKLGSVSRKVLEQVSCPVMLIDGEK